MYDYLRRFLIVIAVALSIGLLFLSATISLAQSNDGYKMDENFIWPTIGQVTDHFGTRNGDHYGIDIAAPVGTNVVSVGEGVVTKSYKSSTYGNVVFIEHRNGYETIYAHLHKRFVHEGDVVIQGEPIGTVGNTGRSRGAHLHFEVHTGNWSVSKSNAIDPYLLLGQSQETFFVLDDEIKDNHSSNVVSALNNEKSNQVKGEYIVATVKKGDSLSKIAESYQVTVSNIKKWNKLSSDRIVVNQKLKILPRGKYIVKRGDSLWKIAEQTGTSVSKIKKINGLKEDKIQVGTLLKVNN